MSDGLISRFFKRRESEPRTQLTFNFNDGPCAEVVHAQGPLTIRFFDQDDLVHEHTIEQGHWVKANRKYLCQWRIEVCDAAGNVVTTHHFDPAGKNIRVYVDSRSLGDTLAWIPQIEHFSRQYSAANVYVSHHWPGLINEASYPTLQFIPPDTQLDPCYATYSIGYYFDELLDRHPQDPRTRSLGAVAADMLGLNYEERKPNLIAGMPIPGRNRPYVALATTSTAECKLWLAEGGWQAVVDWLLELGIDCMVIQKEPTDLLRVVDQTGAKPIAERISQIEQSLALIGLASGLSWLAWAVEKPVIMISGFSLPFTEFQSNCERIINTQVCHGCWNDVAHRFQRDDWHWCPRHRGDERQHECSKQISLEQVKQAIGQRLGIHAGRKPME